MFSCEAAAGLHPYEKVDIDNITNGERFSTYLIRGEKGSGDIGIFGAAGHRAAVADNIFKEERSLSSILEIQLLRK